ncbi:ParB/RepB/Spo0J family partition protein [bacterium]|nr:ParB/RepB/Spo0J family partition protein [candidate division CSSED10-310 bacterium]
MTRKALGKGLSALIPEGSRGLTEHVQSIDLDRIQSSPHQPRRNFDAASLQRLAESIKARGVISPVVVRPKGGNSFELVAGERRWRAARLAGLKTIPALIRKTKDRDSAVLALIENLQREDLNPIELATGYRFLLEEQHLTQEDLAREIARDRATIANTLRLLNLPAPVQDLIRSGRLSTGHAKVLLSLKSTGLVLKFAALSVQNGWSVRALEEKISRLNAGTARSRISANPVDPILQEAVDSIRRMLATKISVTRQNSGGGKIILEYYSEDDLIRILDLLGASGRG